MTNQMNNISVAQIEEAQQTCDKAYALLIKAYENNSDRQLIDQALEIYRDVIQQDIPLADPYLGMAYLSYSIGKFDDAMKILDIPHALGITDPRPEKMKLRLKKLNQSRIQRRANKKAQNKKIRKVSNVQQEEDAEILSTIENQKDSQESLTLKPREVGQIESDSQKLKGQFSNPKALYSAIEKIFNVQLGKAKTTALYTLFETGRLQADKPLDPKELGKLQQLLGELKLLEKKSLQDSGELGTSYGSHTRKAVLKMVTQLK